MLKIFAVLAMLTALFATPVHVQAGIDEGEFDIQGWCITGPDFRASDHDDFFNAVTGLVNNGAVLNDPPHVHVDDLIKDGWIPNKEALYGRSFIFSGYWVADGTQRHFRAYVPKSDNALEEVSCEKALNVTSNTKDQYLPEGTDVEMLRQKGLGSDGQTNTEQLRPRGKE